MTTPQYVGIDVAGMENTWICGLAVDQGQVVVQLPPRLDSLAGAVEYCRVNQVLGVAIDAQLTMSVADENGFRPEDYYLRDRLPADCRTWVASFNSLMGVPIRGGMLVNALGPGGWHDSGDSPPSVSASRPRGGG